MHFTDIFVKRPVLAVVISLLILIAGVQAISDLSVRQYPRNDNATVTINTAYIGASAELVRGFITTPIERAVAGAEGVEYVSSDSQQGLSSVAVRLELNYDPIRALSEITSKINQVRGDLPTEAEVPTINVESADSEFAAAYLSFTSDILEPNQITDFLDRIVQPRLARQTGVQEAEILGGRTFAMRIWLDPQLLGAHGITPLQVRQALGANNYLAALGRTKGQLVEVNLSANTNLSTPEEFQNLVLRSDGDETLAAVRDELDVIRSELPSGLEANIAYDSTEYIDSSIREVAITLAETLLIVMLVIYLFLGSLRSVIVPIVAIPISLIGAVFLMQLFGFSINLLTLLAIVLSVGLVVDDAIVVVENVERHIDNGMSRMQAAIRGARELLGPVIAMTATLVAVYLPIGLQGGLTGSLFREFAFTLAGAVTISGIVAVTLSPMMSAALLREGESKRGFAGKVGKVFGKLRDRYMNALSGTLQCRPAVYMVWIFISLLCIPMFINSPKELAPTEDQGVIFGIVDGSGNATIDAAVRYAAEADKAFQSVDETAFTFQLTFPNGGFGGMVLDPWNERDRSVFEKAIQSGLFAFPPIIDTKLDRTQSALVLDRDRVADLGLTMQQVGTDVGTLLGGGTVNRFDIDGRSYPVIPQALRAERLNPEQLSNLYVTGPDSTPIQLGALAQIEHSTVPRSLKRFQQLNAVMLSGVTITTLDKALSMLEEAAVEILPSGYSLDYTGESRQLRLEGNKFLPAFGLAVVLIYLTLAAQFNSFRDPFVILAGSVPLAMFGALIFTFLKMPNPELPYWTNGFTTTLNIYSQVGLVTLIGLVAKNGILVVEFAKQMQQKGLHKLAAIEAAASTRFRPILMTTVATVAGHFPLVLVTGAGAEARNSIGLVLVGGMAIGTLFTLFVIPSIYMLIARDLGGTLDVLPEEDKGDNNGGAEAGTIRPEKTLRPERQVNVSGFGTPTPHG